MNYPPQRVPQRTEGFSGSRAANIVGVTYRQLDYWARTDLIRPSMTDANGSGSRRRYSLTDLLILRTIRKLLDAGIRLQQVRILADRLRQLSTSKHSGFLVISNDVVMIRSEDQLIGMIEAQPEVFSVLSMSAITSDLDTDIDAEASA